MQNSRKTSDQINPPEKTRETYPEPGFWETLKEQLFDFRRPFDCIQVEVSSICPGRCSYCPRTVMLDQWQSQVMPMETFQRLWPLLRESTRVHLQGWGEPLLNPHFFSMTAFARRAGCRISTTTCGLKMNEEIAQNICDGGIDIVAFSLAGTDRQSNASRRGVDFDRVCEAVATLQAARKRNNALHLEIHFAYLLLASQMEALERLPFLMQRLGVNAAVISTLDYVPHPSLEMETISGREPDRYEKAVEILNRTATTGRKMGLTLNYHLPDPAGTGSKCHENITRALYVSTEGWVSPCVYVNMPVDPSQYTRRVYGNVNQDDPMSIWNSDDFTRFRENLAAGRPDEACLSCPKRYSD